jgi:hypothetical protein
LKNAPPKQSLGVHFRGKVGKKSGTETETELSKKAEKAENGKRKTEFRPSLMANSRLKMLIELGSLGKILYY